ncbi:unnamed protein product, partial [Ostreobium quekettii]
WRAMSAPGSETGLEMVQARLEGAPHNVPEAVAEVEGSRPRPAPGDQFPPSAPPHVAAQGPPGEVGDTKGATNEGSIEIDMNEEMCTGVQNETFFAGNDRHASAELRQMGMSCIDSPFLSSDRLGAKLPIHGLPCREACQCDRCLRCTPVPQGILRRQSPITGSCFCAAWMDQAGNAGLAAVEDCFKHEVLLG